MFFLDKNKFLTTFNEKPSAKNTAAIQPPHELRKFQDLRILDIAAGLHHILLFAVSRVSPSISLDITSSDPNENIPVHTLPESDASVNSSENKKQTIASAHQNTLNFKNIVSPRPLLTKETLEAIQADVQSDTNVSKREEPLVSKIQIHSNTLENSTNSDKEKPLETTEVNEKIEIIAHTEKIGRTVDSVPIDNPEQIDTIQTIQTIEKLEEIVSSDKSELEDKHIEIVAMDMVSKSVSGLGDSLMNDIKSIANAGEEKLNDLAKETEKTIKEVPKNVIDYVKTSVGLEKEETDNVDDSNMDDKEKIKEIPKQPTDVSDNPPIQNIDLNEPENEKVKHNNKLNRAMAEDDSNETIIDDFKDDAADNEVKFINNGIDVSSTSNIIQAMKEEMNEMSNDVKNKSDELTMKYDGIINDELNATKEAASTKMFQLKNGAQFQSYEI